MNGIEPKLKLKLLRFSTPMEMLLYPSFALVGSCQTELRLEVTGRLYASTNGKAN